METTLAITYTWEPDIRRRCDTLRAMVSPENSQPFEVRMTGVHRKADAEETLKHGLRREVLRYLSGLENLLTEVDGALHCPVVRL